MLNLEKRNFSRVDRGDKMGKKNPRALPGVAPQFHASKFILHPFPTSATQIRRLNLWTIFQL